MTSTDYLTKDSRRQLLALTTMRTGGGRMTGASPIAANYQNVDLFKVPEIKHKKSLQRQRMAQTFRTL